MHKKRAGGAGVGGAKGHMTWLGGFPVLLGVWGSWACLGDFGRSGSAERRSGGAGALG